MPIYAYLMCISDNPYASKLVVLCFAASVPALNPVSIKAQEPTAVTKTQSVGGDVGVLLSLDEELGSGLDLSIFYQYYISPRFSFRLGTGWADAAEEQSDGSLGYFRTGGELIYHWNVGRVRPFIGVGGAAHRIRRTVNGSAFGDPELRFGATFVGGVEVDAHRAVALKWETRYYAVERTGIVFSARRHQPFDPDGISVSMGIKTMF